MTPPLLRFAPSPTGLLHLGGLRTALLNHLFARKTGGKWLLRIEDTDVARTDPSSEEDIKTSLHWAGLEYDYGPGKGGPHGPYRQSERKDLYLSYTRKLLDSGHAYHCFCSPGRLEETRNELFARGSNATYDKKCLHLTEEEVARRVKNGEKSVIRFNDSNIPSRPTPVDLVFGTLNDAHASLATDPVLLKSDYMPTYHLASVVDDHEMGITHVLRGEEWITSLPLHLDIYASLKISPPQFAHLPLLLNADGSKLSKRKGSMGIASLKEDGWEPEAVVNWLGVMGKGTGNHLDLEGAGTKKSMSGTNPSAGTHTSSLDELIAEFDIEYLTHRRTIVDFGKLKVLNKQWISRKVLGSNSGSGKNQKEELMKRAEELVRKTFENYDNFDSHDFGKLMRALEGRLNNINEVPDLTRFFFTEPVFESAKTGTGPYPKNQQAMTLRKAHDFFQDIESDLWTEDHLREYFLVLCEVFQDRTRWKHKDFLAFMRRVLTMEKKGLPLPAIMALLGKDRTLGRFQKAEKILHFS